MTNEEMANKLDLIADLKSRTVDAEMYAAAASALRRVEELERERHEALERIRLFNIGMAEEAIEIRNDFIDRILAERDAARAEVAGLRSLLEPIATSDPIDSDPEHKRIKYVEVQIDRAELEEMKTALSSTAATAEAYKRRVQAEVYDAVIAELWNRVGREEYGHAKAAVALNIESIEAMKAAALRESA